MHWYEQQHQRVVLERPDGGEWHIGRGFEGPALVVRIFRKALYMIFLRQWETLMLCRIDKLPAVRLGWSSGTED